MQRPPTPASRGKQLPLIGKVEISIIEESRPCLLAFNSKQIDYLNPPLDLPPDSPERTALYRKMSGDADLGSGMSSARR